MKHTCRTVDQAVLLILLAALVCGCASAPPGTCHPGTSLVLCTKERPPGVQAVSMEAERFLETASAYLHLEVPPAPLLRIYHYPNRFGLWWHLGREVPSLQWRRGACYETEEAYVIALRGNPEKTAFRETLRHELSHYLLATHFCGFPPWVDEGLAQVLEADTPFPGFARDRVEEVQRDARRSSGRECRQLLRVPPGRTLSPSQYRTARAITYHLLTRPSMSGTGDLIRFLESSRPDADPEQIFFESWGVPMGEACREMLAWGHSGIRGR